MAGQSQTLPYAATKLKAPFKLPGGKNYLCRRLLSLVPSNVSRFVDLYGGSAMMTLNASHRWVRHYNDLDPDKFNVMAVMQDPTLCVDLHTLLLGVKYNEKTFTRWLSKTPSNAVEQAAKEIILRRMSRGGAKKSFAWSERLRGGQPGDKNAWENFLQEFMDTHRGLQNVFLTCLPALSVLEAYLDDEGAVIYLDPPYAHHTRVTVDLYEEFEMSIEEHAAMAAMANDAVCRMIISGYRCDEYDTWFKDWRRIDIEIANHQSQAKVKQKKIESIWMNY